MGEFDKLFQVYLISPDLQLKVTAIYFLTTSQSQQSIYQIPKHLEGFFLTQYLVYLLFISFSKIEIKIAKS